MQRACEQVITTAMRRVCYIDAHVFGGGRIWIALAMVPQRSAGGQNRVIGH